MSTTNTIAQPVKGPTPTPKNPSQFEPNAHAKMPVEAPEKQEAVIAPTTEENPFEMKHFPDGTMLEWDWSKEGILPHEHPLFNVGADALQVTRDEAYQQTDIVQDIVGWALELLQDDSPDQLYNFLQYHLRRSPIGGNRLYSFHRYMEMLRKEV